ncbi:MAG: tetratricopeptide repeat protein [Bryobacteraceae bacterium]|nr:tetratricopeptide repeat protein [Bryobacteraceae bacterium]
MIAALGLVLLLQASSDQGQQELSRHVEAGLKAKASGQLDIAVREFRRVAQLAPNLAAAHVNLGAVLLEKAEYANAVPSLKRALALDPTLSGAHSMLGSALLAMGFAAEAIPHLETGQARDLLGVALLESGRPREAVEHLEAAWAKRPDDPDLLYYLSHAYGQMAQQSGERLARTNSPRSHQIRAEGLAAAGKSVLAIQHFRTALAGRSGLRGVHYALGELYLLSGDYSNAEAQFRAEVQLVPGSAAAAYKLGSVLLLLGQVPEATRELQRADELQPGMPETLLELGKVMNSSQNFTDAVRYLKQLLESEPDSSLAEVAHFQLAHSYKKLGNTTESEIHLKRFQQLRAASK